MIKRDNYTFQGLAETVANFFKIRNGSYTVTFTTASLTQDRTITLPDASFTLDYNSKQSVLTYSDQSGVTTFVVGANSANKHLYFDSSVVEINIPDNSGLVANQVFKITCNGASPLVTLGGSVIAIAPNSRFAASSIDDGGTITITCLSLNTYTIEGDTI